MRKYEAILFDLDGTLLPMDMNAFMNAYFKNLCGVLAPTGLDTSLIVDSIWKGTGAMVKNDGTKRNKEVFWETFDAIIGTDTTEAKALCDSYYTGDFHKARAATKDNPMAKRAVDAARAAAGRVVLATNPFFPHQGQLTRIGWIGLSEGDFDLITSYDSDCYCKPNPKYYLSICERLGISPEDCLMIGNDEREDAYAANLAGLDTYLVTDCLIPNDDYKADCRRGTFEEMCLYLEGLAK